MTSCDAGLLVFPGLAISVCTIGGEVVIDGLLLGCDITEPSSIIAAAAWWLLTMFARVDSITCWPDC